MPKTIYCWRCQMEIPMLDEEEWKLVVTHLNIGESMKRYRRENGAAPQQISDIFHPALDEYHRMTGFRETGARPSP